MSPSAEGEHIDRSSSELVHVPTSGGDVGPTSRLSSVRSLTPRVRRGWGNMAESTWNGRTVGRCNPLPPSMTLTQPTLLMLNQLLLAFRNQIKKDREH